MRWNSRLTLSALATLAALPALTGALVGQAEASGLAEQNAPALAELATVARFTSSPIAGSFPSSFEPATHWAGRGNLLPAAARVTGDRDYTVEIVQTRNRAGLPWIIAGSALVVGGAIVGDDVGTILMAGGVVGVAYGLYIYF
jgi:hypothetical protein